MTHDRLTALEDPELKAYIKPAVLRLGLIGQGYDAIPIRYEINTKITTVCEWVTEMGALYGRLNCGWLGVVLARQADLSCMLGVRGRCASTAGCLVFI